MNVSTWNSVMNTADIDFDKYTLVDAIGYAEFEEDLHSWEQEIED
jgi:hypothetical protein